MKFHFLGTCSGTEPMSDMHHQSWVLEINGINYWFDAGENCAHRAHTTGIDVMQTAAIFVSHPHTDHIGGLANLFTCMRKIQSRYKRQFVRNNQLQIFFPDMPLLDAIKMIACSGRSSKLNLDLIEHPLKDGILFEDENIRVSALHNQHLKEDGTNGWHAYSFLLEVDRARIVFSGDVRYPEELLPLIGESCDMLIMETGHHDVEEVMRFAIDHNVRQLRLTHHGRQILEDRPKYEAMALHYSKENPITIKLCYDGMSEEF